MCGDAPPLSSIVLMIDLAIILARLWGRIFETSHEAGAAAGAAALQIIMRRRGCRLALSMRTIRARDIVAARCRQLRNDASPNLC